MRHEIAASSRNARPDEAPTVAVIIPAHNEEALLGRTLESLRLQGGVEVPQVVVVANGCTDGTAGVARAAGVKVLESAIPSKAAALSLGDASVSVFPRVYLDADIVLTPGTLDALANVLRIDGVMAAAPRVVFDVSRSSWIVRAFYSVYRELPYVRDGLLGLGVYGLSASGRARFRDFPNVTGDDLFIQRLFRRADRVVTDGEFIVSTPRNLANLVAVRTRTAAGNAELSKADIGSLSVGGGSDHATLPAVNGFGRTSATTTRALVKLVASRPRLLPGAVVYAGVTIVSRAMAAKDAPGTWHRDDSTR